MRWTHRVLVGLDVPEEWRRLAPTARRRFLKETAGAYLFLLPALAVIGLFHLFAIFYAFTISLFKWSLVQEGFVGLGNYIELFHDGAFRQSLGVTLWYVLGTVPAGLALALLVAVFLFRPIRGRALYRTLFFLPYVTSLVAAAMVWQWMYSPTNGVINTLLMRLGVPEAHLPRWLQDQTGLLQLLVGGRLSLPDWLAGPSLALVSIVIMSIWSSLGFNVIVYLAGLGNIPGELQEAARVDGASEWQVFRGVTLPLLAPTTFFLTIIATIRAFQAFNQIYMMAPNDPTTRTLTMFIFQAFYGSTRVGYGAAAAMALFVILLILTGAQLKLGGERATDG